MSIGVGPRRLASWIESFSVYADNLYAPEIFRCWAAISIISGAMERKVWAYTRGSNLYPNTYILLVGPPGVGKGLLLSEVNRFWYSLTDFFIAPVSVTKSSLIDALDDAKRKILRPTENPPYIEFNSLQAAIPEFSDFAPMYDPALMSILQSLYDCNDFPFTERRRSKDINIRIGAPQLSLIGGTTPSYLNTFMPDGAWDQGFISRTIMAFSGETMPVQLFAPTGERDSLREDLKHDLKIIHNLYGRVDWTQEAATAIQTWVDNGEIPLPDHRRLLHYNTRRKAHLIKLCMVASVARGNDLTITVEDFQSALNWLVEVEFHMSDIFKAMASGGDSQAIEDTWHYVWRIWTKEQKPILESRISAFLIERVPSYAVKTIIELMIRSNMLRVEAYGALGKTVYVPIPKSLHGG